jgi:hypothetical protein
MVECVPAKFARFAMRLTGLFYLAVAFLLPETGSAQTAHNNEIDYTNASLRTGIGYDAVSGQARGECVNVAGVAPFSGLETLFEIKQVEHTETLARELNLSASAGLSFQLGGGSLKGQFAQSQSITTYSTFVLVKTVVRAPVMNAHGLTYNEGFSKLLKTPDGQNLFRASCGDYFISGYVSGGEFYGVIQIESTDQDSKQSLEASLNISYGVFDSAATFGQRLQTIIKDRQVKIRAYQGGGVPKVLTPTPDGLIKLATELPTTFVDDKGKYNGLGIVYALLIVPYSNLPPPDGAVVAPLVASNQVAVLDRLNRFALAFDQQINDINYIFAYPERFLTPDLKALSVARNQIIEMKNKVIAKAGACFNDSMNCTDDPTISFVEITLPKMKGASTCQNPIYYSKTDPKCGILFNEGTGSECGQICAIKADPRCGVKQWNSGSGSACPAIYRNAVSSACPVDHVDCRKLIDLPIAPDVCSRVYSSCRNPANGIEGYETCENPAFGIREYASCQVCEGFKTCRHPDFGIVQILSCRLPEFGLEACADPH